MSSEGLSGDELLAQMGGYECALGELLSLVESDSSGDESFKQAVDRLAEFGPLLKRLEAGNLPTDQEFTSKLQAVRLQHGMLSQAANQEQAEVGAALAKVRETRRKTGFYGATGSDVGLSCDMAG